MIPAATPTRRPVVGGESSSRDVVALIDLTGELTDAGRAVALQELADGPESTRRFSGRGSRLAAVGVGLVGLMTVIGVGVVVGVPAAERHLRADIVRHVLPSAGGVTAEVDGREVRLRGSVDSTAERRTLIAKVGARWGVARVDAASLTVARPKASANALRTRSVGRPEARIVRSGPSLTIVPSTKPAATTTIARDPGAAVRLQSELTRIRRSSPISFAKSSPVVATASGPSLDALAAVINRERAVVRIEAHTDASGDAARNTALSQLRADAVRNALLSRGVSPDLLVAIGRGEAAPIASNLTALGRERNRRVEFVVVP